MEKFKIDRQEKTSQLRALIQLGIAFLIERFDYSQRVLVDKLQGLHIKVATPTLNNIVNDKPVSLKTLKAVHEGILEIIKRETGYAYNTETGTFEKKENDRWEPEFVPEKSSALRGLHFHHEGRVPMAKKTTFIADAQQEIIEVGVRLSNFTSFFTQQNEKAYKAHIIALLRSGVNFNMYLLDPDSQDAMIYFSDRAQILPSEQDSIAEIKKVIAQLQILRNEFKALNLKGAFEVFIYRHIPYGLFYVVDGNSPSGKMMISPYLYGIKRADCPVIEIIKKDQPALFRIYMNSMMALIKNAKPI